MSTYCWECSTHEYICLGPAGGCSCACHDEPDPTNHDSTISYACGHVQTIANGQGYRSRSEMRCPECMGFTRQLAVDLIVAAERQAQEPSAPTGLQWGQCCDCGASLWVPADQSSPDANCTPCHVRRLFGAEDPTS